MKKSVKKRKPKHRTVLIVVVCGIASYALLSRYFSIEMHADKSEMQNNHEAPPEDSEGRNIDSNLSAAAPSPILKKTKETQLPEKIRSHLPTRSPASLQGRWGQSISSEDDLYIASQLTLDNRPVENYYFRWKKASAGDAEELVAGVLPEVKDIKGEFPSNQQSNAIAEEMAKHESAQVLSMKEVWNLNSQRVLTPLLKVEVQVKSRSERDSQRSSGHEYWFISINTGQIVKRLEADRF